MGINEHFEGIKIIDQAKKMILFYKIYQLKMLLKPWPKQKQSYITCCNKIKCCRWVQIIKSPAQYLLSRALRRGRDSIRRGGTAL